MNLYSLSAEYKKKHFKIYNMTFRFTRSNINLFQYLRTYKLTYHLIEFSKFENATQ